MVLDVVMEAEESPTPVDASSRTRGSMLKLLPPLSLEKLEFNEVVGRESEVGFGDCADTYWRYKTNSIAALVKYMRANGCYSEVCIEALRNRLSRDMALNDRSLGELTRSTRDLTAYAPLVDMGASATPCAPAASKHFDLTMRAPGMRRSAQP